MLPVASDNKDGGGIVIELAGAINILATIYKTVKKLTDKANDLELKNLTGHCKWTPSTNLILSSFYIAISKI
jgi:hypothetical protein